MGSGEGSTMRNFTVCTIVVRVTKSRRLRQQVMQPEWKKVGVLSKSQQVNLQERNHQGGLGVDGRTILEWNGSYRNRYQYEELGCFGSGQGLLESPCGSGTESQGSISMELVISCLYLLANTSVKSVLSINLFSVKSVCLEIVFVPNVIAWKAVICILEVLYSYRDLQLIEPSLSQLAKLKINSMKYQ